MSKITHKERDFIFLKMFIRSSTDVTDEAVEYFREHPDEIDEITAPVYIHKLFLWGGAIMGTVFVGASKVLNYSQILDFLSEGVREFAIDLVFEVGVALIGAAVTAYILGVLLNKQQENATKWRGEIRRRIGKNEP